MGHVAPVSFLARAAQALGLKRAINPVAVANSGGMLSASVPGRGPPKRGTRELIAAYREQPWLRAVVGRIASGVASASWSVYVRAAEGVPDTTRGLPPPLRWGVDRGVKDIVLRTGNREARANRRKQLRASGALREVPDHPLLELLAQPNPELTGMSAMRLTQTWLDIVGEAFWLLSFDAAGALTGWWPVPPHWVQAVPTQETPTYRISIGAVQIVLPKDGVVWFRDPNPLEPYGRGTGVAESLGDELETDEFAAKYLKGWFFNNAMPNVIIAVDGLGADALKQAKEKYLEEHRGAQNAHRAFFTGGKTNVVRLDASFRDQQITDLRKLSRDTVAQVFAVPPEVIGIIENSNRSTIGAARYIYALGVELPRCEFLRSEMQAQLSRYYSTPFCLECEVQVPDDETRRLDVMRARPEAFDLNEWRAEAGHDPLPEFDGVFPSAMPGSAPTQIATPPAAPEDEGKTEAEPELPDDAEERSRLVDPPWAQSLGNVRNG